MNGVCRTPGFGLRFKLPSIPIPIPSPISLPVSP